MGSDRHALRPRRSPSLRPMWAMLACAMLSAPAGAWAEPTAEDRESARNLMKQGDQRYESRDYARALQAYRGAHEIMNVPSTGMAVARSLLAMNRLLEAREMALAVTRMPVAASEPDVFVRARAEADKTARELEKRIPSISVKIEGVQDLSQVQLSFDGVTVPRAAITLPRKVNPGKHLVIASAPRLDDAQAEVTVKEGEAQSVVLTLRPRGAAAPPAPLPGPAVGSPPPPATAAEPQPAPSSDAGSEVTARGRTLAYVGFSVAGAGVLLGSITGLASWSKTSELQKECPAGGCPPGKEDDLGSARTMANVSNVSFALAVAGAGVGLYGVLFDRERPAASTQVARWVRPSVGAGTVVVQGRF